MVGDTWRHFGDTWRHLGDTWRHLATPGDTWRHLATLWRHLGHLATRGAARRRAKALWRHFGDTLATLGDTGQRFIAGSIRPQLDISIDRLRALPAGSSPEVRQFCKVACATAVLRQHPRIHHNCYSTAGFSTVGVPSMYDRLTRRYWTVSIVVVDRTAVVDVSHRCCACDRAPLDRRIGQRL